MEPTAHATPRQPGRVRLPVVRLGTGTGAVLLALLATVEVIVTSTGGHGGGVDHADVNGTWTIFLILALCTTLPLAWSESSEVVVPTAAAGATTAASVLSLVAFDDLTVAGAVAQLVVLYRRGRAGARVLAASAVLPYLAVALAAPADGSARVFAVVLTALGSAAVASGGARWARGEALVHSAAERAFADTVLDNLARGERARIARELHDVVAHHISMISVQAENTRLTTPGLSDEGAKRLLAIGDTARAALTEMRRLLGVLREDAADAGAVVTDRHPQPSGLDELVTLLDETRAASGGVARLIVSGPVASLDPGVELAAYRIVQEALTNARRHAPGAAVDVELRYFDDATVDLRVRDNGPGRDGEVPRAGHGLLGMRERAAAVGGELRAGSAPGGGFLVAARLPGRAAAAS